MIHQKWIVELNETMPPKCGTVSYCCPKSTVRKTPNQTLFNHTRRSEARLTGKKIIPNKELYSRKYKNGRLTRHKYRHTARGDFLRAGVDYGNSYWSSASSTTLKIFCAIAAEPGHQPKTIDVSTAYLELLLYFFLFLLKNRTKHVMPKRADKCAKVAPSHEGLVLKPDPPNTNRPK
jgi:hypothetical protein